MGTLRGGHLDEAVEERRRAESSAWASRLSCNSREVWGIHRGLKCGAKAGRDACTAMQG